MWDDSIGLWSWWQLLPHVPTVQGCSLWSVLHAQSLFSYSLLLWLIILYLYSLFTINFLFQFHVVEMPSLPVTVSGPTVSSRTRPGGPVVSQAAFHTMATVLRMKCVLPVYLMETHLGYSVRTLMVSRSRWVQYESPAPRSDFYLNVVWLPIWVHLHVEC